MYTLTAQALATLSEDELKTILVQRVSIADPNSVIATRDQLISAILKIKKAA